MKSAVIALALLFPSVALAQEKPRCADFDKIVKSMSELGAKPFMYLLQDGGKTLVVYFGDEKTTEWVSFVRISNSKTTCMVDSGIGFGVIPGYRGAGI